MTNGEKIPTPIAQAIDAGGKRAQYDAEAKKFLSNVEILSRIMKRVVPEFKDMDLDKIKKCILNPAVGTELLDEGLTNITGENTESSIPSEGCVTFDVKFSTKADRNPRGKVILDMETLAGADLLEVILIRIPRNVLTYRKKLDDVIRMLGIAFSEKIPGKDKKTCLEQDYGIKISMEEERRLAVMCNLSEGFWEDGREQEKMDTLKSALDMGLSDEQIQKLLRISAEELNQMKQELLECV